MGSVEEILQNNWPFAYLNRKQRQRMNKEMILQRYKPGERILSLDEHVRHAYLIVEGSAKLSRQSEEELRFKKLLRTGILFGIRFAILHIPSNEEITAQDSVLCAKIPSTTLIEFIRESPPFSQAISRSLKQKQSLFSALSDFSNRLEQEANSGSINIEILLPYYKAMQPALHPKMNHHEIDFGAWSYAINRLPQDIAQTHIYLLSQNFPELFAGAKAFLSHVPTKHRRRKSWSLCPGKSLVLIRDGHTDLTDFVGNLCLHVIESQKIRRQAHAKHLVPLLFELKDREKELENVIQTTLQEDWTRFKELWPQNPIDQLRSIVTHHEDYVLYVERNLGLYDNDSAERWIEQIRKACITLYGDLDDLKVDIISSNSYGALHCLSPAIHRNRENILRWGKETHPEIYQYPYANPSDRLYALLNPYMDEHKHIRDEVKNNPAIIRINNDSYTGIGVDLINPHLLQGKEIDENLTLSDSSKHLIVNIDYAFGQQAEDIIGCLILLFHHKIRSIHVMGKAGSLVGKRGDILYANQVLLDTNDEAYPMVNQSVSVEQLKKDAGRSVFVGNVLTVQGTLLQNRSLLSYYRYFWDCVGLEMEGSFYARQIQRARSQNLLSKDVEMNFIYFISDLPLEEGSQLSKDMGPHEFAPPLYAITRAFLQACFNQ
ncbi:MAG: cyclic nucleotide-binding domain-containing protein [Myxococcota bacterium]|nr:cyclic nucleotide-binding domain-containing protein [Myxococcota bacterium]